MIAVRGKNRQLEGAFCAGAFGACDDRASIHDDTLIVRAAIVANIFIDWHCHLVVKAEMIVPKTTAEPGYGVTFGRW
jgi:hypothetical protein